MRVVETKIKAFFSITTIRFLIGLGIGSIKLKAQVIERYSVINFTI